MGGRGYTNAAQEVTVTKDYSDGNSNGNDVDYCITLMIKMMTNIMMMMMTKYLFNFATLGSAIRGIQFRSEAETRLRQQGNDMR